MQYHETPESSNIARIGYNQRMQTMHVEFRNGSLYHYPGVTGEQFVAFKSADSKGEHFSAHFRGWPCKKVST